MFAAKWQLHADQRILGKVKLAVTPASYFVISCRCLNLTIFCRLHRRPTLQLRPFEAFCKAHGRSFQAGAYISPIPCCDARFLTGFSFAKTWSVGSPTRKGDGSRVDLNLNRDLAENYVKQIRPLLMNFIAKEEKFIRKQTKELKQKMEDELRTMEGFAGGVIQKTVRDIADAAVRSANLAISSAMDKAYKNAQEGQKHVLWGLESCIREKMNYVYTTAIDIEG